MPKLGRFGGESSETKFRFTTGAGTDSVGLAEDAREQLIPSPEGMPANPYQLVSKIANLGQNNVRNGDMESWSQGTSSAPDNWILSGIGATAAKETTITKISNASAKLTRVGNNAQLAQNVFTFVGEEYARGRVFTLSAWVYATVADRVVIKIDDGVVVSDSGFHPGDSTWRLMKVTQKIDDNASAVTVELQVNDGNTSGYFDGVMFVEGPIPFAFFRHPNDDHLRISNFQDTTPANTTDAAAYRAEIANVSVTSSAAANASKTVTFETAFRTVRCVLFGFGSQSASIRNRVWVYDNLGTSSVDAQWYTDDSSSVTETHECYIMVIGHV